MPQNILARSSPPFPIHSFQAMLIFKLLLIHDGFPYPQPPWPFLPSRCLAPTHRTSTTVESFLPSSRETNTSISSRSSQHHSHTIKLQHQFAISPLHHHTLNPWHINLSFTFLHPHSSIFVLFLKKTVKSHCNIFFFNMNFILLCWKSA